MTTLSVPLSADLAQFIETMVTSHKADNKAAVVRRALYLLKEQEGINAVMEARQDVAEGRVFGGDLHELAEMIDD